MPERRRFPIEHAVVAGVSLLALCGMAYMVVQPSNLSESEALPTNQSAIAVAGPDRTGAAWVYLTVEVDPGEPEKATLTIDGFLLRGSTAPISESELRVVLAGPIAESDMRCGAAAVDFETGSYGSLSTETKEVVLRIFRDRWGINTESGASSPLDEQTAPSALAAEERAADSAYAVASMPLDEEFEEEITGADGQPETRRYARAIHECVFDSTPLFTEGDRESVIVSPYMQVTRPRGALGSTLGSCAAFVVRNRLGLVNTFASDASLSGGTTLEPGCYISSDRIVAWGQTDRGAASESDSYIGATRTSEFVIVRSSGADAALSDMNFLLGVGVGLAGSFLTSSSLALMDWRRRESETVGG